MENKDININELEIVEWIVNPDMSIPAMMANSFVSNPAMEGAPVYLSEEKVKLSIDDAKQTITAILLEPFKPILRSKQNEDGTKEYYLAVISPEEIEKVKLKFLSHTDVAQSTTLEHKLVIDGEDKPRLVELWTVLDSNIDKSIALGIGPYPVGSLLATYYIPNKEMYNMFKEHNLSFSGEFLFMNVPASDEIKNKINPINKNKTMNLFTKLSKWLFAEKQINLADFKIEDDKTLVIGDGDVATIDGQPAPDGDYKSMVDEKEVIITVKDGIAIDMTPVEKEEVPVAQAEVVLSTEEEVVIETPIVEPVTTDLSTVVSEKETEITNLNSQIQELRSQLELALKPKPIDVSPINTNVDLTKLTYAQRLAQNAKQLAKTSA